MFLSAPSNPSKAKRAVYLSAATILGILLSFLTHAAIEMSYLSWAQGQGIAVTFYNGCALTLLLQIILPVLGALGGFLLGRIWWRKVYIDRTWAKKIGA